MFSEAIARFDDVGTDCESLGLRKKSKVGFSAARCAGAPGGQMGVDADG